MPEETLIFIRHDFVDISNIILTELDARLKPSIERVETVLIPSVPREIFEKHYSMHKEKDFYEWIMNFSVGNPVVLAIYRGEDAIQRVIQIAGPTDPSNAPLTTIRGFYSRDSLEQSRQEKRMCRNVLHRSDSIESYLRERKVWQEYLTQKLILQENIKP